MNDPTRRSLLNLLALLHNAERLGGERLIAELDAYVAILREQGAPADLVQTLQQEANGLELLQVLASEQAGDEYASTVGRRAQRIRAWIELQLGSGRS